MPDSNAIADRLSAVRQRNSRLRDMRDNLDGMLPWLVQNGDGAALICAATLPMPFEVDPEPYPILSPQMRLRSRLSEDQLRRQNGALLSEIEQQFTTYGNAGLEDINGAFSTTRANPAGYLPVYGFQVVWSGGRRQWGVLPGKFTWLELDYITGLAPYREHEVDKVQWVDGSRGWVVIRFGIQPLPWRSDDLIDHPDAGLNPGYSLTPGSAHLVDVPRQIPPTRSLSFSGAQNRPEGRNSVSWSAGTYDFPLARVTPPNVNGRTSPLIETFLRGDVNLAGAESDWEGSLPHP